VNRPAPLQPAFDFASAPDAISLLQGTAVLDLSGEEHSGPAEVLLRFLPSPRVIIHATVQGTEESARHWFLGDFDIRSFALNGQVVEGFRTRWRADAEGLKLDWCPSSEPMVFRDMASKTSVSALLHLFNFPDFRGGQHQASSAPAGCSLMVLDSDEWRVSLLSLTDNGTQQAWKRIKEEGGCFPTHVGKLERKDGKPFSGDEAIEQRWLLANFLSFTKGARCSTVCEVGLDAAGAKTWEAFASPPHTNPPYSWFNPFKASQAEILFPLFAKRWQQSEEWKDCLRAATYWYTQANTSGGSPGIDAAIILAQAALERLAHQHLVVDRKMISAAGLDQLKISDRLRLLFSSLNIPIEIGTATPDIRKAAPTFKWLDAPHAMTDIRNELVHPVSRKRVDTCIVDAWKLFLWYLELSVLALCGYDDAYTSRLTAEYVTQSEKVPWGKKA
jgi:hypothetical protein